MDSPSEDAPLLDLVDLTRAALDGDEPLHVMNVQGGASALFLRALTRPKNRAAPSLVVALTASVEDSQALVDDLSALAPELRTVLLPAPENTPYDGVRPDRRISLARAAALVRLDRREVDVLVVPAAAWLRKAVPAHLLAQTTIELRVGERVDLGTLPTRLEAGGYQRSRVVEDPGSFAIRGSLLDLWPPSETSPVRAELDFEELGSLKSFDPETQRTRADSSLERVLVPPAREAIVTPETSARARGIVQAICDGLNYPSSKARGLVEDVSSGHLFVGAEAFLPAFAALEPLDGRLPDDALLVVVDPSAVREGINEELERVSARAFARQGEPALPPHEHYLTTDEVLPSLEGRRLVLAHPTRIFGGDEDDPLSSAPFGSPEWDSRSQGELTARLDAARKSAGKAAGLDPLVKQLREWIDEPLAVVLTARVTAQAERLATLLEHRGFRVKKDLGELTSALPGEISVVARPLARGFVLPSERLALLTEEEIFGKRRHRAERKGTQSLKDALDDLRSLSPGDLVVHVEHGIGRYLGLEHKTVGSTAVDLLVVEYQGGDKLFLPVYRLNQIQKLTASEGAPKIDRLGGQTFSKVKSRVRQKVRELADQLLRLYAERTSVKRPPLPPPGDDYAAFEASFPYEETADQAAAIQEVLADLQRETVMDRLVCGDVGFGKTEVALRAAYVAALNGRQVALLCPTTVLAEQHYRTFEARLGPTGATVRALSRFQTKKEQTETLLGLKNGSVDVVVGTHRLLSSDVHFKHLGLLVVDEEQRFGVTHKERIKEMRRQVDVLTLSATPIPRTLSLAVGGLRDMSVINTPPADRRAIRTFTSEYDATLVAQVIEREMQRGGQVYYVKNRVDGIYERASQIQRMIPGVRVGVGHGQMKESDLEKTMVGFVDGDFDVLCATSIIESGLDIPRANTIIVERADLFGLSQLYQIRGRVGRSSERAYCYLLVPPAGELSDDAKKRIEVLERYTELGSGFHVATLDMEIRGTGELLGADQSGFVASIGFDLFAQMLEEASAELSGHEYVPDIEPDLSIDVEALLPETYIDDIGVRLSLYKRFSAAHDENDVARLAEEMSDRFGEPPREALSFVELMRLKTELRRLRALGCTATSKSATLHLATDTPLSPELLVPFLAKVPGKYSLSPDGRLTRRPVGEAPPDNGLVHADRMLDELGRLLG